jgi:hypothetical protein
MPRVQNYDGQQVRQQPLPNARLTAAPSIEGAGAVGNQIARIGAQMYADEMQKQDEVAVLEADRKLSEWENKRLYDPQNGALARRGKDAFGLPDEVNKDLDAFLGEVRGSLSNDRQRAAFERRAIARKRDVSTTLSRHVFGEIRKHDDAETENYLANARQAAVANFQDPARVELEIERQSAAISDFARRNGMGAEYTKQKIAQATSDTHVGVIDRMLANGADGAAKQYFDRARTAIAGNDVAKVEQKLMVAVTEGEGMRAADDVWKAQGPRADADPVNIDTMAEALRTQYASEPGKLKAAMAALKERAAMHNAAQAERAQAAAGAVWRQVAAGASIATITRMPEYMALPGADQARVKEHVVDRAYTMSQRARAEADRADGESSKANYAEFLRYSSAASLSRMSEDQIISLLPKLGRTLTGSLMEQKRRLDKGDDAVRAATIDDALFDDLAQTAGLKPHEKSKSEDDKAALGRLKNSVMTAIDAEQRATGKPLTRERKAQLMQEQVDRKVRIDVWGRDPEMPAALVKQDDRERAYVPIDRVPAGVVTEGLNYLRSKGKIATGQNDAKAREMFRPRLERAYAARLMGATREQIANILEGK